MVLRRGRVCRSKLSLPYYYSLRCIIFSLIFHLGNLGFAREEIRIMTDEFSPWYPPTKENIVSPPCEVLLLLLPLHLIS